MHVQIRQQLEAQLDRLVQPRDQVAVSLVERPERSGKAIRLEVAAIQSALTRLENGTYDECSKCGKPIDPRRLVALPTTTTCLRCSI
ncbi:MAG TPA: TraR/DksA C4-type zinc finger protein [Vicinamibacterales bacterium]|nr:TraR/DksA C4-type zinc finger protein [Vicinamibacterales bacterium]